MTIRGGGDPTPSMASAPQERMGPPPRSFAADAHDCIMVPGPLDPTAYKVVARASRPRQSSPQIVQLEEIRMALTTKAPYKGRGPSRSDGKGEGRRRRQMTRSFCGS